MARLRGRDDCSFSVSHVRDISRRVFLDYFYDLFIHRFTLEPERKRTEMKCIIVCGTLSHLSVTSDEFYYLYAKMYVFLFSFNIFKKNLKLFFLN